MATRQKDSETLLKIFIPNSIKTDIKDLCWAEGITLTNKIIALIVQETERKKSLVEEVRMVKKRS